MDGLWSALRGFTSHHPIWERDRSYLGLPARPLVIGHRGWGGRYPENTLLSLTEAAGLGVDAIEIDVMPTLDGELVLSHEEYLEYQTDGRGRVLDHSLRELRKLDAGFRFSPDGGQTFPYRGAGLKMVSLEEAITALPDSVLYLDLKSDEPRFIRALLRVIREFRCERRVLLCSFYPRAIAQVRRLRPDLSTAADPSEIQRLFALSKLGIDSLLGRRTSCAVHLPERRHGLHVLNDKLMRTAKSIGLGVIAWTINDPADIERLLDFGVDGMMSDHPDRVLDVFSRRGLTTLDLSRPA